MPDIDAKKIEELRGLLADATPGPWEADEEKNEGCYGSGDDCHEGFKSASIYAPDGRGGYVKLFDALNSDAACIEEEYDEEYHFAWDAVARSNAAFIVAMRNALPALLDLAERASLPLAGDVDALCKALLSYQQADADGVMVTVSRQACDEAASLISSLAGRVEAEKRAKEDALEWATVWHKCVETALTILETNPDLEADEAPRAIQERVANLQRAEYDQRLLREAAETRSAALAGRVEASEQTVRIILKESDVYPEGQG